MVHTSTLYLIRRQVELAEQIAELSGIPDAKVFFTNSGTEANEAALLLATTAPAQQPGAGPAQQLPRPVVRGHGGHRQPRLVGVAAVPGQRQLRPRRLPLPQPVPATCPTTDYIAACVDDLRDVIDTTTAGDVACMIAEPIQGVGGFAVAARRAVRRV